jgi:type I restriction enzyme S subunit
MNYMDLRDVSYVERDFHDRIYPRCQPRVGDVLLTKDGANTGNVTLNTLDEEFSLLSSVCLIKTNPAALNPAFLCYYLQSPDGLEGIVGRMTGAAIKRIILQNVKLATIPLPPIAEQQRIVGVLDEAFAAIATARANTEQNLRNARELFDGQLQSVFNQRGSEWVERAFGELIESNVIGLTKNSRDQGEDGPWPYVKMNNITRDNRFDFSRFVCVEATDEEVDKFALRDGDFLFNTRNSYELVGKSCIYESESDQVVLFNNNIMRIRFKPAVDAKFVLLAFSSIGVVDELSALKSGTTNVSAIYFKDLKSLAIPVPPIAEQKTVAAKLESLVAKIQLLTSIHERKLAALDALKQSLLHQAFTGAL